MIITIADPRPLAVVVCRPQAAAYYDPVADMWSSTYDPKVHLKKLTAMVPPPVANPFASVKSADIGDILLSRLDAVALICVLDNTGAIVSVADAWPSPYAWAFAPGGGVIRG